MGYRVASSSSSCRLNPPGLHGVSQVTKHIHHEHPHPLPLVGVKALIERLPCISELFQVSGALGQGISSPMQEGNGIDRKRLVIEPLFHPTLFARGRSYRVAGALDSLYGERRFAPCGFSCASLGGVETSPVTASSNCSSLTGFDSTGACFKEAGRPARP